MYVIDMFILYIHIYIFSMNIHSFLPMHVHQNWVQHHLPVNCDHTKCSERNGFELTSFICGPTTQSLVVEGV